MHVCMNVFCVCVFTRYFCRQFIPYSRKCSTHWFGETDGSKATETKPCSTVNIIFFFYVYLAEKNNSLQGMDTAVLVLCFYNYIH